MMPCVTLTTTGSSLLVSSLLFLLSSFLLLFQKKFILFFPSWLSPSLTFVVNHLPKNKSAAYWLATVAQAAPAAPPNIAEPARGTSNTSPKKLMTAAANSTYSGDVTSCIPKHALCAVPMTHMAGMPSDRIRTYRNAALKTTGSRASLPMSSLSSTFPEVPRMMPNMDPTMRASLSAVINVVAVDLLSIPLPSSLSSCTAAAIKLVVAVYMNAATSAP
mmetsp:Transcript_28611/g.49380  ORF Transcript_28611/g.49380 Transcript_28611/m.49380 type:complete len:218 (-) Transcript_28611:660-1313(-)